MNELPPDAGPPGDIDDRYRRAAAQDRSRPSESVRRAVLEHAAKLAAERSMGRPAAPEAEDIATQLGVEPTAANQRWWRPAIFGTLAAAALAGLLIGPQYLPPRAPSIVANARIEAMRPNADAVRSPPVSQAPPSSPLMAERQTMAKDRAGGRNAPAVSESAQDKASTHTAAPRSDSVAEAVNAPAFATGPAAATAAGSRVSGAALRQAAQSGDVIGLRMQLETHSDIDARDAGGRTALMLATLHGHLPVVEVLLGAGADANAADSGGMTPLQAALDADQPAIAEALRRAGAR